MISKVPPLTEFEMPPTPLPAEKACDAPAPTEPVPPQKYQPRLIWQIMTVTVFRLALNTARRFIYPFAPALGRELHVPLAAVTTLIAVNQTTGLLGLASGPLADRRDYRNMMRTGVGLLAMGMLICAVAPRYAFVLIGLSLTGLGKTVFDPAVQASIGRRVPFARRGMAIGALETAWAGSTFIGIPAIAVIIDQFGLSLAIFSYAALPFIGRSLQAALAGLFLIFLFLEFTIVCSFSLGTELLPNSRATMVAGYFTAAALGRMAGALTGTPAWLAGGLPAVAVTSAVATIMALLFYWWGIRHWKS